MKVVSGAATTGNEDVASLRANHRIHKRRLPNTRFARHHDSCRAVDHDPGKELRQVRELALPSGYGLGLGVVRSSHRPQSRRCGRDLISNEGVRDDPTFADCASPSSQPRRLERAQIETILTLWVLVVNGGGGGFPFVGRR